jgi:methylamine dehydrogenase accessory protein MauD
MQGNLMNALLLVSSILLWVIVLFLGFLLLGTLRALGLLRWQMEQLKATTPKRLGRDGLKPGKKAPDFTLPSTQGREVSLHDFFGRKVLLVYTQFGCSPCKMIIPELNRLGGGVQVLVVNNGDAEPTRKWADEVKPRFPMLVQEEFSVSKRYEVFATPFAFLIDERGVIRSKGIINNKQQIGFVLTGAGVGATNGQAEPESVGAEAEVS